MTIDDYIFQFSSLNTARRIGHTVPHTAVMLLSIIDLIEKGDIMIPSFELTESLENKFHEIWKRYVGVSFLFKPVSATPFYHLCNEPFWKLYDVDRIVIDKLATTPSISYLRNNGVLTIINNDLFELIMSHDCRVRIRTTLISIYVTHHRV